MSYYSNLILKKAPKAYYRLNETSGTIANDSSGNGYNAAYSGATLAQPGSIYGDTDTCALFTAAGGLTLPTSIGYTSWSALTLEFRINLGSGWHTIAVVTDGTNTTLYIDGITQSSSAGSSLFIDQLFDAAGSLTVSGYLDEVVIWNQALTQTDLAGHVIAGLGGIVGIYNVFISGLPVVCVQGTLQVQNTIGKRAQSTFTIYTPNTNTHYQQYQSVTIYDQNSNLTFSGYITQPKEQKPGFQNSLLTQVQCVDQHYIADKRVIAKIYTKRSRASIVQDIFNTILSQEGVTLGAIVDEASNVATLYPSTTLYPSATLYPQGNQAGIIDAQFIYAKVSDALDALTKDANLAGVPYFWAIDQNKKFWWVPYTYFVNANVVDGTTIDQVTTPPTVTRANPLYRNTQYLIGGYNQTSPQTETRVGDGSTRSWAMGYELASAPTISMNTGSGYVVQTVGIKGIDSNKAFYWSQGDATITQDSSQTVLATTSTLQVIYIGQYPQNVSTSNAIQIGIQAALDGTSGIVEDAQIAANISTAADGLSKATGLLTRNAVQGALFEFTTRDSQYAAGQLLTVNYAPHGLNNTQMLVEKVTASDQTDGVNIWYTVDAVLGPYDQTWQDFWSSLIGAAQSTQAISAGVQGIIQSSVTFTAARTRTATFTATVSKVLSLYGSYVASSKLTSAAQMATSVGGAESHITTHISGGGHYGEVTSRGAPQIAVSAIPTTPTGNGWVYAPGASTLVAGNWSAILASAFADWQSGNTLTLRAFKWSAGVYSSIGLWTAVAVTGTARATYPFASTAFGSATFGANDLVYFDLWLFDSSGTGGDDPTMYLSNSATSGVAGDLQITTPGFA